MDTCNDAVNPKTCSDSGICRNDFSDSGYTCYCEPGFTGDDCENGKIIIKIIPCEFILG